MPSRRAGDRRAESRFGGAKPLPTAVGCALGWSGAAAAEVVRAVPDDAALPFASGILGGALVLAAVGLFRVLRRPRAEAADLPPATPDALPPDAASADAEATLRRLAGLLARAPAEGAPLPRQGLGRMVAAAHARDRETLAHSFRVARYAVALARRLDVDPRLTAAIEWGALLHDVGKIAVPRDILHKPAALTAEEEVVMRRHPRHGYRLLRDLVFLGPALDVVLSHHERWDGDGYPNGLTGEAIPLAARVFAVADTYDAITSDRPYRRARTHAEAATEIARVAGTQLDPHLVTAFLAIPEPRLAALRDEPAPEWADLDGLGAGGYGREAAG